MNKGDQKYIQNISRKTRREQTRLESRWEDIKMCLTKTECEGVELIPLAQETFQQRTYGKRERHKSGGFLKYMSNHQVFTPKKLSC
jgi:hypothetical protein